MNGASIPHAISEAPADLEGLKVLYVGRTRPGTNGADRIKTLASLGCHVTPFDARPSPPTYSRLELSLAARLNTGRPVWDLNSRLISFLGDQSFDLAWINKAVWIKPSTILAVKQRASSIIHFTLDSQFTDNRSHLLFRSMPLFDLVVTTKTFETDDYRRRGAQNVLTVRQGYGQRITDAAKMPADARFDSDVTFVGHYQPHYAETLSTLAATGIDVKIWGPNWTTYAETHPWARDVVQGDGLWGTDYGQALGQAKITLCLLSKRIAEQSTTRSMEIPAAGGFMIAERTEEHLRLFDDGKEAVFFSSTDDLIGLVQHYLAAPTERQKIAAAGQVRARQSGYSEADQLDHVLRTALGLSKEPRER
ncbi:MAG: glycosyltransferase [Pseudomonadota bacterium]